MILGSKEPRHSLLLRVRDQAVLHFGMIGEECALGSSGPW